MTLYFTIVILTIKINTHYINIRIQIQSQGIYFQIFLEVATYVCPQTLLALV